MEVLVAGLVAAAVAVAVGLVLRPRAAAAPLEGSRSTKLAAPAPHRQPWRRAAPPPRPRLSAPQRCARPSPSRWPRRAARASRTSCARGGRSSSAWRSACWHVSSRSSCRHRTWRSESARWTTARATSTTRQDTLKEARREQVRELEQISHLSAGQARQLLLRELEDEVRHDSAKLIRQVEEETKRDADRLARNILSDGDAAAWPAATRWRPRCPWWRSSQTS